MGKRGLSPIIATLLLILVALVLAVIIFIWARSIVAEKVTKFDRPVEYACEDVSFSVDAIYGATTTAMVENKADVPIYGFEIKKKDADSILNVQTLTNTIGNGMTSEFPLDNVASGDNLLFIPIVLGEAEGFKKAYTCDEKYSIETQVI